MTAAPRHRRAEARPKPRPKLDTRRTRRAEAEFEAPRRNTADARANPFTFRAKLYAYEIAVGKRPANRMARLACERFCRDLKRGAWQLDADRVERVCQFAEMMPHVKGKWARTLATIVLEDWQVFILANIFGWIDRATRLRRFRRVYIELPRKNGKSILAAIIGLYMLVADGEPGAEVYCGATTEKQAWEVFRPARLMARRATGPDGVSFLDTFLAQVFARSIALPDESRFVPIIGNPGDGSSPHCSITDEYHEHQTSAQYDAMVTGMGAREQPIALIITTAGENIAGPCHEESVFASDVLEGKVEDDELFAIIFAIDNEKEWRNFEAWERANPNLGVSIERSFLRARYDEAVKRPAKRGINLTKHAGVWVSARAAWLSPADWDACARPNIELEAFRGHRATIGLDLSTKVDVGALVARVELPDDIELYWPRLYVPSAQLKDPNNKNLAHYVGWAEKGWLIATPGDVLDYEFIERDLDMLCALLDVYGVGYDKYQGNYLATRMTAKGVPMFEYGQTVLNFSQPSKEFEASIIRRKLVHPANQAFDWMAGNVCTREDAKGNIFPTKPDKKPHLKIDGLIAAIMAKGLSMANPDEGGPVLFIPA